MKHFPIENPFLTSSDSINTSETTASPSPLSSLRLAVKDLFHIAGLPTTAGNPTWLATHSIPTQTASSVTALIEAGAEFCGKTITDELAYSLNGQNIHYGTLINPLTPNRLPGGSSSGSAIAVAKELAEIGLGTDTGGSIRVPASYNGLFGLRPTHGVIAVDNLVALAPSFDTVGLLTRDLATLTKATKVLLGSSASASALPAQTISKVLVADNLINQVAHVAELKAQLANWRDKGLLLNEATLNIDTLAWQTSATFRTLQGAEIWQGHGEWVTLVTEHGKKSVFAPDIQTRFAWCETLTDQEIQAAQQQRTRFTAWLENELQDSLLIIPTTPGLSPLLDAAEADLAAYRNQLMDITAIAGLAGLPQLHLPVCTLDGAPCGLSLVGPKGSDLALIDFATHLME